MKKKVHETKMFQGQLPQWGACIRLIYSAALLHDIQRVLLLPFREGGAVFDIFLLYNLKSG